METSATQEQPEREPEPKRPRRLFRSRRDRVIGGVCGGLGEYFNVDPIIFRIAAVVLVFLGGAGALLYLAGLLLIPEEAAGGAGAVAPGAAPAQTSRALSGLAIVVLVIVAGPLLLLPLLFVLGSGLLVGALIVPLAVIVLVGFLVWWLMSGTRPSGGPREILSAAALGIGLLLLCGIVAIAGGWAAAVGGGTVTAALVIAAGAMLVVGAFAGRSMRWLILPALALALPVALVSAADIDLKGGVGEREYRPASAADLREHYRLGMGRLVVDLRNAQLPRGDTPLDLDLGIGEVVLAVPSDVCVATRAQVGMGDVQVFDRDNGGVDVDWEDTPQARPTVSRIVVDTDIGLGAFRVTRGDPDDYGRRGPFGRFGDGRDGGPGNEACINGSRS